MSNCVLPHRYIKIVNAYVLKMCFHIYTHGAQKSRHSGCVSTKTWEHACVSSWIPKWQGNSFVFPAPITIVLGKVYVLNTCFFCVSSRLKSVVVFLAQAHPKRCLCQKLFTFWDQKLRKGHAAGKTELPKITWQLQKNTKFNAKQKYKKNNVN